MAWYFTGYRLIDTYILRGEQKTQSVLYGMRTIGQGEVSAKTEILRNQEHTTSSKSKGTQ